MNIFGKSTVSLEAAQAWARKRGGHQRYIDVAEIYWRLAPLFDIPPEIPYGQAGKETAKGHYTGVVGPERHNWCGLKKSSGGDNDDPDAHAVFASDYDGVLAHLWHLHRYGGRTREQGPNLPMNDPRYHLITDFTDTVEGLGGPDSWAPSPTYGVETSAIVTDLRQFAASWKEPGVSLNIRGLEDVRHLMARNPNGGNAGRRSLPDIHGWVYHFNGPDVPDPSVRSDRSFVIDVIGPYHAQKDFGSGHIGDGVMYHIAILRDGTKLWLRDFEVGLWHCGNTPWNENSISIYVHLGINQRATSAQLQAAREVADDIRAFTGDGRDMARGHMELSSTNCPGTLMNDLVRPYRAATDEPVVIVPDVAPAVPGAQLDPWRFDEAAINYAKAWNDAQPFWVLTPFVDWLHARGGLMTMGYVVSGAFIDPETNILTQWFEGGALEWHPENAPESRVLRRHTGLQLLGHIYPERVGKAA